MAAGQEGAAQTTSSVSSIVSAIVFNVVIFVVFVTLFLILRPRQKRIYQPKAMVATIKDDQRPRPLKAGIFNWAIDLLSRPDSEILEDAGLDGYFFLRYVRLLFYICLFGVVVLYPILLAVNGTGGDGKSGFDLLAFGNVKNSNRYYAHVLLGWIFYGFILFTLYREMLYYISVRQAVLTSPAYSNRISSRTVLISTVPPEYLDPEALASLFDGVKYVWINRNQAELADKVNERTKLAKKLEGAVNGMLKTAVKNRLKSEKKAAKKGQQSDIQGSDIDVYIKKRPSHRLTPLIGRKVDTLDHNSNQIEKLNAEIAELQHNYTQAKPLNSAFVCFHTQLQAEEAAQVIAGHRAFHLAPRHIGVQPRDVVWMNLRLFWWERLVRSLGALLFISALVIFWAVPVAFVGTLSNIKSLQQKLPWLDFLNHLPKQLFGLVSSLLPTVLLAVLMMLLPIVLRLMGRISGSPSGALVEYYVQNAYFAFQVVQVFLVTTISSGATAVVEQIIDDPTSTLDLLSANLPKAANFFISYFMLQGFTACGGMLLQITALILFHVLSSILDNTPRKIWTRWNVLGGPGWGTIFPVYTNLGVIAIAYALISPILLVFAAVTFLLIYFGYLHNLMFINIPTQGRGMYYCRALFQTFVGLYISQICMLGLFIVSKAWGPIVLQAIMLLITVAMHLVMNQAFDPLKNVLPRDLLRSHEPQDSNYSNSTGNNMTSVALNADEKEQPLQGSPPHSHLNATSTTGTSKYHDADDVHLVGNSESKIAHKGTGFSVSNNISIITRYFKPYLYLTPENIARDFLPASYHQAPPPYTEEEESMAYASPFATDTNPVVWFPRDPWGLSDAQVETLRRRDVNAVNVGSWYNVDDAKKKFTIDTGVVADVPVWAPQPQY